FSIELGGFIGFSVPSPNRRTEISGELTVHQDVAGGHGGGVAMANLQYGHQINRQWRATLGSNVAYGGSDYMDSFYTVSPEAAIRSGLPGFDADAGLKSASVRLGSSYAFSPGWGVFGQAAYTRLLGDAKDSPVVNLAGNADQVFFGVGVFRTY
ncbi:MAG: MipA/OmpV family protein, partial [Pseudomonadota bacterium]